MLSVDNIIEESNSPYIGALGTKSVKDCTV